MNDGAPQFLNNRRSLLAVAREIETNKTVIKHETGKYSEECIHIKQHTVQKPNRS